MGDRIASDICSWNTDKAPLMYAEGNDVFTFTAYFAAGDTEFKFISATDTYFNAAGTTGVLDLTAGGTLTTDAEKGDNKFKMAEAGWYKITCDLQAMTIKAEKRRKTAMNSPALPKPFHGRQCHAWWVDRIQWLSDGLPRRPPLCSGCIFG